MHSNTFHHWSNAFMSLLLGFFPFKGIVRSFTFKWTILRKISCLMLISISKRESLLSASVLAALTSLSEDTCWGKSSMVRSTVNRGKKPQGPIKSVLRKIPHTQMNDYPNISLSLYIFSKGSSGFWETVSKTGLRYSRGIAKNNKGVHWVINEVWLECNLLTGNVGGKRCSFFKKKFYWSIVDLQSCVSFRSTKGWISYTYTYNHSF